MGKQVVAPAASPDGKPAAVPAASPAGKPAASPAARKAGKLSIVATPIGNLGDITLRAIQTLEASDVVFAEDTRVTAKLLAALKVKKPIKRLDEQVLDERSQNVIAAVEEGKNVAYCTDAGMPGVSDPGARLIRQAYAKGIEVEVLPGASAASLAYVASGTLNTKYYFGGFFPRKEAQAIKLLDSLQDLDAALIFYESPKRIVATLSLIAQQFPYREVAVCRELTKLHEEVLRLNTEEAAENYTKREATSPIKGEIALVIDGPSQKEAEVKTDHAKTSAADEAKRLLDAGLSVKDITKKLVKELKISRNEAYEIAVNLH